MLCQCWVYKATTGWSCLSLTICFLFFWLCRAAYEILVSPTRGRTHAPCSGSVVLSTGPPGKASQLPLDTVHWPVCLSPHHSLVAHSLPPHSFTCLPGSSTEGLARHLYFFKYLFVWLCWVLVAACRIFSSFLVVAFELLVTACGI